MLRFKEVMSSQSNVKQKKVKTTKQRRVLGCIGWAFIFSLSCTFSLLIEVYVIKSVRGTFTFSIFGDFSGILYWFFIFLFPSGILSMVIGSRTRPTSSFWRSSFVIAPSIMIVYTLFWYYLYSSPLGSPPKPPYESFWNPPEIGLTTIFNGMILGLIISYGYWHAGRGKKE